MKINIKLASLTLALFMALVASHALWAAQVPSAKNIPDLSSDTALDTIIDQYMQNLLQLLPDSQKSEIDAYRQYVKDSISSVVPPGALKEQLQAAQEMFPSANTPGSQEPAMQQSTDQSLVLAANPSSPAPKTEVTVTANFNIDGGFQFPDVEKGATTQYNWSLDNTPLPASSGVGHQTLKFTSGTLGTIHSVRLQAKLANGRTVSAALLIPVVDADIVWYTDTYTPLGYRGKALPNSNSPIVATAQTFIPPNFGLINYVWTIDDDTPMNAYGIGKNRILIALPQQTHAVSVKITDLAGNIEIDRTVYINRADFQVLFHRLRSGEQNYETAALSSFDAAPSSRLSIIALPYFFNVYSPDGLRFSWTFDGSTLTAALKNPDIFTLNIGQSKLSSGSKIVKSLDLTVNNKNPNKYESQRFIVPITIR